MVCCSIAVPCPALYFVGLRSRPLFLPHPSFFSSSPGDVTQLQLPPNMKELKLYCCVKITGTFLVFVPRPVRPRPLFLPHLSFLSSFFFHTADVAQLTLPANMKELNLCGCDEINGTFPVFVPRCSSLPCGPGRTASLIPFPFSPLSFFFSYLTGDVAQLQLPANMETLNLRDCKKITGAFLIFLATCGQAVVLLHSFYLLTSFLLLLPLQAISHSWSFRRAWRL